jgi:hypothetical protein
MSRVGPVAVFVFSFCLGEPVYAIERLIDVLTGDGVLGELNFG